jgi:hypothetical protein
MDDRMNIEKKQFAIFQKATQDMIATNDNAYSSSIF